MLAKTKAIRDAMDTLNLCYDWTKVHKEHLPAALQADKDLDAMSITIEEWERAWHRAGKVTLL